jgi:penicillin-binding protein 2
VLGLLLSTLVVRLFWLQVLRTDTYRRLSEENRARMLTIQAPRGTIRDRLGRPLARDVVRSILVAADTAKVYNVSPLAGSPVMVEPGPGGVVSSDLTARQIAVFEESPHHFPGLHREGALTRQYPGGQAFCHVVGYVGEVSERDMEENPTFRQGDLTGRSGLEKTYQEILRGTDGWEYVEVDARGTVVGPLLGKEPVLPVWGNDVHLTLDADLQTMAYELLCEQGQGAVVALEPRTGEILALVSSPGFDPNLFSGRMTPSVWQRLNQDPGHPLLNRAIQSAYPPGSVFKLVIAACGLDAGSIDVSSTFKPCTGALRHGRRVFRCWKEEGHGRLAVPEAIVQSCDVFFYQLALELGLERMSSYARAMGFGTATGVEIGPEVSGLVPTREWYDEKLGPRGWTTGVLLNLGIGQGELLVTPLQVARFMAGLANGRMLPVPHLSSSPAAGRGRVPAPTPLEIGRVALETLRTSSERVVSDPRGTAHGSMIPGIALAGKTGTAQNPAGDDHSWFACYAPADDPKLAVAVLVENAGHGSTVAAPLASALVRHYLSSEAPVAQGSGPNESSDRGDSPRAEEGRDATSPVVPRDESHAARG